MTRTTFRCNTSSFLLLLDFVALGIINLFLGQAHVAQDAGKRDSRDLEVDERFNFLLCFANQARSFGMHGLFDLGWLGPVIGAAALDGQVGEVVLEIDWVCAQWNHDTFDLVVKPMNQGPRHVAPCATHEFYLSRHVFHDHGCRGHGVIHDLRATS